jgi:ribonuclease HI
MVNSLQIFTDGGCSGNPGPGGWAYVMVLRTFQGEKIIAEGKGAELATTNNRMELTAAIAALKALRTMKDAPRLYTIYTDSQYVQQGITGWINKWKCNSWRTSDKKPVKNQDLWMELDALATEMVPDWEWVEGHAGHKYNELCDRMTHEAISALLH